MAARNVQTGGRLVYMAHDGHVIRYVELREIDEGTVAVRRYRVAQALELPVSEAARRFVEAGNIA